MVLTNTPISAHDNGTRRALQPRVAPMPYFTCQNWILALVVICDQTGALVIGTAHEHFIQARDFECTYRSRSLVFRRLLMNSTDFLPRLMHHATYTPDPQVEQMSTDHSRLRSWSASRSLRSRFADHSLRLPTLQALRNCID